ncbi:MAG: hypothetical protein WC314_11725 [Vulcanimicrobiota bacterium]
MFRTKGPKTSGITVAELAVGFTVFGILMSLLAVAFISSRTIWERASSSSTTQLGLRKGFVSIAQDLQGTDFSSVRVATGPISLTGWDGDVLWFRSAVDPTTGEIVRTADGHPLWQRNIIYYSVVPNQHLDLYGFLCRGSADLSGYESQCPHKILVRKVVDNPPATGPGDPPEEVLSDVTPYLTRPAGLAPSGTAQAGLEDVSFESRGLLSFRAELAPNPQWPGEVRLQLSAAREEEARRSVAIGQASLEQYTDRFSFSIFPPVQGPVTP